MPKYTLEEFYKIAKERKPNLEILEEPKDSTTPIKCKCNKCGYISYQSKRDILHQKGACPVCNGKLVVKGINDMLTTAPKVAKYFTKDFAETHTKASGIKGLGTCPDCGFQKMITPSQIYAQGFGCNKCSDGVSYPNKLSRAFLTQLPIENLICEYCPNWTNEKIFYDNYFKYNNQEYILEMDGGLGHGKMDYYHQANPNSIKSDQYKDKLAQEHNIKIIRIDCSKSNLEYIKNNILNSELSKIFDLSNINWIECDKIAEKSIVKIACNLYTENPDKEFIEIAKLCNISTSCLKNYLEKGSKLGFCTYNAKESAKRSGQFKRIKTGTPIEVYNVNTGELIGKYPSMNATAEVLPNVTQKIISYHIKKGTPYLNYIFKKGEKE